jgi:hypothetical protein
MKTYPRLVIGFFFVVCCLLPAKLSAKGMDVDFWMEGSVSGVAAVGDKIHFTLKGKFWFAQYDGRSTTPNRIEVDCKKGISVTVHQNDPFFAFSPDWGAGAIQEAGGLLRILKAATGHDRIIKFELLEPAIVFDAKQTITLTDAAVIRATDADL